MWIGWQAPSSFHGAQLSNRSATQVPPASNKIHRPKKFDSELKIINAGLIQSSVLFSGWGEKLLERKNVQAII